MRIAFPIRCRQPSALFPFAVLDQNECRARLLQASAQLDMGPWSPWRRRGHRLDGSVSHLIHGRKFHVSGNTRWKRTMYFYFTAMETGWRWAEYPISRFPLHTLSLAFVWSIHQLHSSPWKAEQIIGYSGHRSVILCLLLFTTCGLRFS